MSPRYANLPARDALVLEWLGDGNALDTNDGTKATLTATNVSYASCPVGYQKQWGVFNGSSSNVSLGSFEYGGVTNRTVLARINHSSNSGTRMIWSMLRSNDAMRFSVSSGFLSLQIRNKDNPQWIDYASIDITSMVGKNLDVGFDLETGTRSINTYVGLDSSASGTYGTFNIGENSNIGSFIGGASAVASWFSGNIGGVRCFNRVLTKLERLAYFHEFNRQLGGGSDFGAYIPAPAYQWDFSGDGIDVANGVAPSASTATFSGVDEFGIVKGAAFSSQYITVPNIVAPTAFTWVHKFKTSQGTLGALFDSTGSSLPTIYSYMGLLTGNKYRFQYDPDNTGYRAVESTTSLNDGNWHTVMITGDTTTNGTKLYVDGVLEATDTSGRAATLAGATFPNCGFGRRTFGGGSNYLTFSMADTLIFPVAFSQAQVTYLTRCMRSGRYPYAFRRSLLPALGITAYYDGTFSGSTAYDTVGGWGSKSIGGTMPASVRFQQNKSFAPTGSQYIALGTQNHYDANGWWYGQWISTTSSSEMRNEFNSSNGYFTMLRYNNSAGKAGAFYHDTVSDKLVNGVKTINDGRPHFCVAEFLPGSYARIWVDGVMEASVAVGAASWLGIQEGQYIFSGRGADSEFLSGKADFMYGKGTLNPAKVRAIMYATYRF